MSWIDELLRRSVASVNAADLVAAVAAGLGLGLSLIIVIGAQNAFVLRQGIRREHVLAVVTICTLSDAVLILAGISGVGLVVTKAPLLLVVLRYFGAVFLLFYGVLAARRALRPDVLRADDARSPMRMRAAVLTVLALTWLNPHVYLDTVLLIGSIANTHGTTGRWAFGAGAVLASALWFAGLGFGARLMAPVFARPIAWRILDAAIALTMFVLGLRLLLAG